MSIETDSNILSTLFSKLGNNIDININMRDFIPTLAEMVRSIPIDGSSGHVGIIGPNDSYGFTYNPLTNNEIQICIFPEENKNFKDIPLAVDWFKSIFRNELLTALDLTIQAENIEKNIAIGFKNSVISAFESISYSNDQADDFISICFAKDNVITFVMLICVGALIERLLKVDLTSANWKYTIDDPERKKSADTESILVKVAKIIAYSAYSVINAALFFVMLGKSGVIKKNSEPGWLVITIIIFSMCLTKVFTKTFKDATKYHLAIAGGIFLIGLFL